MRTKVTIDPLYGNIELPLWLIQLLDRDEIRRMMFIRQLGLKAYIDFPGAIHTRYSHSLGVMHLAGRIVDLLQKKAAKSNISQSLKDNTNTIMAAGFFHDIGHGPFSHVLDYPLKKLCGRDHEEVAENFIRKYLKSELEQYSIPVDFMTKIIRNTHNYQFLCGIINGPLDVDKIDYILRDSYHVGLKYSFDIDFFANEFVVLGEDTDLSMCELGLEDTRQAIDTAEIYILIWRNLYDLVYHIPSSRVAEKMLEKAIFCAADDSKNFKKLFTNLEEYTKLKDDDLFSRLEDIEGFPREVVERIYKGEKELFKIKSMGELTEEKFKMSSKFLDALHQNPDALADDLSRKICEEMGNEKYRYICDIIGARVPKEIHLNEIDPKTNEPITLSSKSPIVRALEEERIEIKVYIHPNEKIDEAKEKTIKEKLEVLISEYDGL